MIKVLNRLGTFFIKGNPSDGEIETFNRLDFLKCINGSNKECTIFDKDIISKSQFIRIN